MAAGQNREEQAADRGRADGAADLQGRAQNARGDPALMRRHAGQDRVEQPGKCDALAEAGEEHDGRQRPTNRAPPNEHADQQVAGHLDGHADRQQLRAQTHQMRGRDGAEKQPHTVRHDGKSSLQRRDAKAFLLVDAEQEIESGGEKEQGPDQDPAAEGRYGQQPDIHQRHAAAPAQPVFIPQEPGGEQRRHAEHGEDPQRPAEIASLRQWQHDRGQGQGAEHGAAAVQAHGLPAAGLRQHDPGRAQRGQADRQLQQEHRPPAQAEGTPLHQRAAGELPDRRGHAHHDAVRAHGARQGAFLGIKGAQRGEHLRHDHCRGQPLHHPPGQQPGRRDGDAAHQGTQGEHRHPGQEHPAPAIQIAQPAAGDQEHRVGPGIAGDDQLKFGRRGPETLMDRRQSDVDDEEIDRRQEPARQQHGKRGPACAGAHGDWHVFSRRAASEGRTVWRGTAKLSSGEAAPRQGTGMIPRRCVHRN